MILNARKRKKASLKGIEKPAPLSMRGAGPYLKVCTVAQSPLVQLRPPQ